MRWNGAKTQGLLVTFRRMRSRHNPLLGHAGGDTDRKQKMCSALTLHINQSLKLNDEMSCLLRPMGMKKSRQEETECYLGQQEDSRRDSRKTAGGQRLAFVTRFRSQASFLRAAPLAVRLHGDSSTASYRCLNTNRGLADLAMEVMVNKTPNRPAPQESTSKQENDFTLISY